MNLTSYDEGRCTRACLTICQRHSVNLMGFSTTKPIVGVCECLRIFCLNYCISDSRVEQYTKQPGILYNKEKHWHSCSHLSTQAIGMSALFFLSKHLWTWHSTYNIRAFGRSWSRSST